MRLNPREAIARRVAAADAKFLSAKINECRLIAAMLWHSNFDRMNEAQGRAAIEMEYRAWKRALPFMHFFATYGVLHFECPRACCKRARRCACDSMRCVRFETLSRDEMLEGRAAFNRFVYCMRAPENESGQGVVGRG
ncbi:MAG TPA: hypothetical protein VHH88_11020 [Verrucomicrobiae bacterium]|nr:hypothetical protein [Verrucomicrobiae bacterium]